MNKIILFTLICSTATVLALYVKSRAHGRPGDADPEERLTHMQFEVTQRDATEPPFDNAYWNNHRSGIYVGSREM